MSSQMLHGTFVSLRPLRVGDAELTYNWRQSNRAKFLNQGAASIQQQTEWIASRPKSEQNFIIELKSGLSVGMLSLIGIDHANQHGEPSRFLIGDEAAVKGLPVAVEAMKLLYELAFDHLQLVRVFGIVAANNHLMIKWQKYMGMKEEGRLRNHLCQKAKFYDAIYFGLLIEEYRRFTLPRMNFLISTGSTKC